jgi:hypothetical protein
LIDSSLIQEENERAAGGREGWSTTTAGNSRADDCACTGVTSIIAANIGSAAPSHPAVFKHAFISSPHRFAGTSNKRNHRDEVREGYNGASITRLELVLLQADDSQPPDEIQN